jgi:hypothetical protein
VKRLTVVFISVLALFALSATLGGAAWSAAATSSTAQIIFDDAAQQAELIIPTPACPASQPTCEWKFFLNEPKLSVDVATVYGTSGTLTIPYPANFCGVIQADAYVGPPFVPQRGFQHTIEDCTPPTTTTTTTTTTTMVPPVVPPVVTGNQSPPPSPPAAAPAPAPAPAPAAPAALPFTATPTATPASAAPTQLPFTGVNTKPLWFLGLTLVALGLALLTSAATWRKLRRQVLATVQGRLLNPSRLS